MVVSMDTGLLKGQLRQNESLAEYTSWRVGGPAKQFYLPTDINDLSQFLALLPTDEPLVWLGLGSNVLIRDGGIQGTVILTLGTLNGLTQVTDNLLRVEAGVTCAKLAKYCVRANLTGGSFFAGIPGTVGGALAMNAGAFGGETWTYVTQVETIDRQGNIKIRAASEFKIGYREVKRPHDEWFIAGYFRFPAGDGQEANRAIKALLAKRGQTQPIGQFSCGSVFRNPPGDYAARLIEACDLKGKTIGDAEVSLKHANFIINRGKATAADIETLIYLVQETVEKAHHVRLIPECHIIGESK